MIDILHPAHVHFFRSFITEMEQRGHEMFIASRRKDVTTDLLDAYGIKHHILSTQRGGATQLTGELIWRSMRFIQAAYKFKPDYLLGLMGPVVTLAARVVPARSVVFYDNETTPWLNAVAARLNHAWWSPRGYIGHAGPKHQHYDGYHEMAYLHPNRFTPNKEILHAYGVDVDAPYFVVRFISWESMHDFGESGFSIEGKRRLIKLLEEQGRVFISSEKGLPSEFEKYRSPVPVEHMHHLLAFARIQVGESSTMASEAACLGSHAVFVSTSGRGVNLEQEERYGIVHNFNGDKEELALKRVQELIAHPDLKADALSRAERMRNEAIDVTEFLITYFESDCRNLSQATNSSRF